VVARPLTILVSAAGASGEAWTARSDAVPFPSGGRTTFAGVTTALDGRNRPPSWRRTDLFGRFHFHRAAVARA
jgi:hypothetical protein